MYKSKVGEMITRMLSLENIYSANILLICTKFCNIKDNIFYLFNFKTVQCITRCYTFDDKYTFKT